MDILGFAKKIEKEGYEYYKNLSKDIKSSKLAGIFKYLADEEQKHYRLFDAYQGTQQGSVMDEEEMNDKDIILKAKAVFMSLSKDIDVIDPEDEAEAAYQKAISLEKNSISFYKYAIKETEDPKQKKAIEIILDEEMKHLMILKSIVDFVKRPKEWLENAEWHQIEEY
jgi:rubrerythrin